jgi:adenine-specific DNA-methyltransferase
MAANKKSIPLPSQLMLSYHMPLKLIPTTPKKSINAAFLKVRPLRNEIDTFKANLINLLDKIDEAEREDNQKTHVRDFLVNTYYKGKNEVNSKGTIDQVIHIDSSNKSPVGVIIETKRPSNKAEWITPGKPNGKALQECVLYYLRERIEAENIFIKNIIITNIYEWYIIDAVWFEKCFYENKSLVNAYKQWSQKGTTSSNTALFYTEIAGKYIESMNDEIPCTYFDIRDYEKELRNTDTTDDKNLIELQKLLSEFHLLKVPFANDSNKLDKRFYSELLHIIGLTEIKEGSKKLIGRHKEGDRMIGSILEDTILQLDARDKLNRVKNVSQYGNNKDEKLFNIALELTITWVNRILFLKLLEGQLLSYHKGDKGYLFLNHQKIREFDQLDALFFQVLAKRFDERNIHVSARFDHVPYLNSSLFEPTELEHDTLFISNLSDDKNIPIHAQTVLKAPNGSKRIGELSTLEYLFAFLDAYDFSGEGSEDIQEDNKPLINASVLGLIFEKVNGYKDGSIFTPGFITMYMSRETIRRAVVQKFNEVKGWNCKTFEELKEDIQEEIKSGNRKEVRKEANRIINSLRIIDPAVGSGHFLVSVLNELIAIKSELKILVDDNYEPLSSYSAFVLNDELILTDEEGGIFSYNPKNKESQRIQETLFQEKQTIIENCLFGVDINPNSVKICRLRLWIELLKNAYYKNQTELETLPNIDINIKCGNSLVSRFAIDADLKPALKESKWNISSYRNAITTYHHASNKDEKRELEGLILAIKQNFTSQIRRNDPLRKRLDKLASELYHRFTGTFLFEPEEPYGNKNKELENKSKKEQEKLEKEIEDINKKMEEIKNNTIYLNSFEWRFEFPDVLSDEGDFLGFDVVIGNPPYIRQEEFSDIKNHLKSKFKIYHSIADLLTYFVELSYNILKPNGIFQFIISNKFTRADYGKVMRQFLLDKTQLTHFIDFSGVPVFDEATVDAAILGYIKSEGKDTEFKYFNVQKDQLMIADFEYYVSENVTQINQNTLNEGTWSFQSDNLNSFKSKIEAQGISLKDWDIKINRGILTGLNQAFVINEELRNQLIQEDPKLIEIIKPMVRGRDIQKYNLDFEDLYLIGFHNGFDKTSAKDINEYPVIKKHLDKFEPGLSKRYDKGSTPYNLRNCVYWQDFEKPKIMYPEMTKFLNFAYDDQGYYSNNKVFILTGEQIEWLTCFFNSKLWAYCFRDNFPELLGGTRELRKVFMEEIKVKKVDDDILETCKNYLRIIKDGDTTVVTQIDQLVYELYGLTEEEIRVVEGK